MKEKDGGGGFSFGGRWSEETANYLSLNGSGDFLQRRHRDGRSQLVAELY
jgi:hypothetical protein